MIILFEKYLLFYLNLKIIELNLAFTLKSRIIINA